MEIIFESDSFVAAPIAAISQIAQNTPCNPRTPNEAKELSLMEFKFDGVKV